MSDYAVTGDELKNLLKIAKKRPLQFAYCPAQSAEKDLLALHRKKPGAIMAKALRAEGEGNKLAFGTLSVGGKLVTLECEKVLPALARKVKKFLKFNKVQRNVRVLDADGNLLEEDIEDLAEDPDDGDDIAATDADDTDDDDADTDDTAVGTDDTDAGDQFDASALVARIKAMEPRIAQLGEDRAAPLRKAMVAAIGFVKDANGPQAEGMLDRIDAALLKLGDQGAPSQTPPQAGTAAQQKLQQAAALLAQRVKALPEGDMRAMLAGQVRDIAGAIREGAVERAITGLKALQTDLEHAESSLTQSSARPPVPGGLPLDLWNEAKSQSDLAITRLQERLKQEHNPDLDRIAEFGLNGVTEGNQAALMKRLFEFRAAPPAGQAAAAEKLVEQTSEYRKFLAGSELIALCEQNPFVTIDIRGPLDAALREIENAVKG